MAGLLDVFNTPEGMQGLSLLAAAGPSMEPQNLASRIAQAGSTYRGMQQGLLRDKLLNAQIDNLGSEADARRASLAKTQAILDLFKSDAPVPGAAMATTQPGQLGSGSFGIVPPPAGAPAIPQAGAPGAAGASRIGGLTPDKLAQLKLLGVDLTDVYKLAQPDMQVSNGYAYDRRNLQPGFLPQANVSQNGQATQLVPDGQGGVRVVMPQGSLEAYSAFRNADEAAKAGSDLVKVYNPATKREEFISRSQVLGRQAPQAAQPPMPAASTSLPSAQAGVQGAFTGDPATVQAAISAIRDPQERANAQAAFEQQARGTPGFGGGANFAAGPSAGESAAAAAAKATAEGVAKDVVEQRKSIMNAGFVAPSNIARYQRIGKLLQDVDGGTLTASGTQLASLANSLGLKLDKNLPNKEAAASLANAAALELRNPAGGAGMPGAMSDQDRAFLSSMTPNMSQSAQGRKLVIDAYVSVQQRNQQVAEFARKYEKKYGKLDNDFFSQLQSWSNANPLFKGQ